VQGEPRLEGLDDAGYIRARCIARVLLRNALCRRTDAGSPDWGACRVCDVIRSRQPKLVDAALTPADLKPGDAAVLTVKVVDKHELVRKVEGVIREDPVIKFKLHDDGVAPDEKAHDNIWSLAVDVPFQAPPGEFILDLTAYGPMAAPSTCARTGKWSSWGPRFPFPSTIRRQRRRPRRPSKDEV